jgi:hypothetical protein
MLAAHLLLKGNWGQIKIITTKTKTKSDHRPESAGNSSDFQASNQPPPVVKPAQVPKKLIVRHGLPKRWPRQEWMDLPEILTRDWSW